MTTPTPAGTCRKADGGPGAHLLRQRPLRRWPALLFIASLSLLTACAGRRSSGAVSQEQRAAYQPAAVKRVALVEPKDFTPEKEAAIRIEDPITGTLIRTLRARAQLEVLPGHVPLSRDFVQALRAWYRGDRRAAFPSAGFTALRDATPADAYLVVWIDRSSRPWVVNEALEQVPADRYQLELTGVLLDPAGRVFWGVASRSDLKQSGELGAVVKQAVEQSMDRLVQAFAGGPLEDSGKP